MAISMQPAQAGFAVVAAISNRRTRHPALIGYPPEKFIFKGVIMSLRHTTADEN